MDISKTANLQRVVPFNLLLSTMKSLQLYHSCQNQHLTGGTDSQNVLGANASFNSLILFYFYSYKLDISFKIVAETIIISLLNVNPCLTPYKKLGSVRST